MKAKCKRKGCYEPRDCLHGYCAIHCTRHPMREYSERREPKSASPHLGVEIEVEYPDGQSLNRGKPLGAHHDGSLGTYGAEYKVLSLTASAAKRCTRLLSELYLRKAQATSRCGVHVHIDVRSVPQARLRQTFDWLLRTEDVWFSLVPPSRRRNQYLLRIPPPQQWTVRRSGNLPDHHYVWAHLTPYTTLEIRIHPATLNPHKLSAWIAAMAHLQACILDPVYQWPCYSGESPREAFDAVFAMAPAEARDYLETRLAHNGVLTDMAYQPREE